jgi:hypothetical protein
MLLLTAFLAVVYFCVVVDVLGVGPVGLLCGIPHRPLLFTHAV